MTGLQKILAVLAGGTSLIAAVLALVQGGASALLLAYLVFGALTLARFAVPLPLWLDGLAAGFGAVALVLALSDHDLEPPWYWVALVATWAFAWLFVERLSLAIRRQQLPGSVFGVLIPVIFGLALLLIWEIVTRGANVPMVLLPPPSQIWARIVTSVPTLWADFQQTFLKAVLAGYAIGCGAGFLVAIAVDRSPFLKRGLLPIGNFVSALPIIGIAPILVMWFGFDWPSKAAVVVCMTFFPCW